MVMGWVDVPLFFMVIFSWYVPCLMRRVSPAVMVSAAFWMVRQGCVSVPGLLSFPSGET